MTRPKLAVGANSLRNVVASATVLYLTTKLEPSVKEVAEATGHREATVAKIMNSSQYKKAMESRGFHIGPKHLNNLTPQQLYCIRIMTDPSNRASMAVKCKQAGISYATYQAWLKQPIFANSIHKISEDMLGEHIHDVHTKLLHEAMDKGNIRAIELYYQITGKLIPKESPKQTINVEAVIMGILETLTKYITDRALLNSIASEFERVMSGETDVNSIETFPLPSTIETKHNSSEPIKGELIPKPPTKAPVADYFTKES